MRVRYPKLRNIVHTNSLLTVLLLPKNQTILFYLTEQCWRYCRGNNLLLDLLSHYKCSLLFKDLSFDFYSEKQGFANYFTRAKIHLMLEDKSCINYRTSG